ncbi:hypothetical protein GCM10022254_37820 [Actinomadura meridiana]|uniref:Uncharacterized protein n=1 Tax=Actinomadura meridiana TaxID=559626 RepID=A0ABP8C677_9ACTN
MSLSHLVDQLVRAAVIEDRSFDGLLPQLMEASRTASPTEMGAAMPRMADGIAEAPPNLGGWLAIVTGAWIENGADPGAAGPAVVERITDVTAGALTFANAWQEATGGAPPDMEGEQPSQQIFDTIAPKLEDRAIGTRACPPTSPP